MRPARNHHRSAFTLLELVAAMTIIVILGTITVWGVRSVLENSRVSATRILLQNGDGMFSEWLHATGTNAIYASQPWPPQVVPADLTENRDIVVLPPLTRPLASRNGEAVAITRGMMYRLIQCANVKKMVAGIQNDRLYTFARRAVDAPYPQWASSPGPVTPDYSDPRRALGYECLDATVMPWHYVCMSTHDSPAPGYSEPRNGVRSAEFWLRFTEDTPVLLDSWRNPILFVPACGFVFDTNKLFTTAGTFTLPAVSGADPQWVATRAYNVGDIVTNYSAGTARRWIVWKALTNHTSAPTNAPGMAGDWLQIPTQPFFASAGPDGIFYRKVTGLTTGMDDNIYSFNR